MALTKVVNGVRMEMSAQEEAETRARWQAAEERKAAKEVAKQQRRTQKDALLARLGLTADEAKLLLENLDG